jgi:hypothetical protein
MTATWQHFHLWTHYPQVRAMRKASVTFDRFLDVSEFTTLTSLSLLISCKLSIPIVGLKLSPFPTLTLKSSKIILVWCFVSVQNLLSSRLLSKNLKIRIYKNIILPVVLYGCETWSLTLKEEHRLIVFENRVLRKIFGSKRDYVTGEWRKLHSEELLR